MYPLLEKGDVVLVHSNCFRTLRQHHLTPRQLLEAMLEDVGEEGTLIFPVFFFSWCDGEHFDIRKRNGETGVLGNAALGMGAVRSGNPVYSFAAIGKQAWRFEMDNYYMLGRDTPFDLLLELDANIAVLDATENNSMTFYHHIEKMENVAYRFEKVFPGFYTDRSGYTSKKRYSYFVRQEQVVTDLEPMSKVLWLSGCYQGNPPFIKDGMRIVRACELYQKVAEVLVSGGENFTWRRAN